MIATITKGANKKGVSWLYFVMYIAIIIIVIVIITKVYKAIKQGGKDIGNLAADATISTQTNIPIARLQQIRNIAEDCYKNRFQYGYVPWDDWNEAVFVSAINKMQDLKELQLLCQYYQEVSNGKSIAFVVKDSFAASQIAALKTGYYSALLSF